MTTPKKNIKAAQAEAEPSPHTITVRGEDFSFKRILDWPAKSFEDLDKGYFFTPLSRALADYDKDFERFDALEPTLGELAGVFGQLQEQEGIKGGNS